MTSTARIRTVLLILLAALTLCVAPAGADEERLDGPKDNRAVAEAGSAGDSVLDLAFSVRETASEVVDETNTAVAYANCEACRAVAIAFQIVIVQGSPDTVTPQNVAIAVNDRCPDCSVLAISYQFVIGRGEPLELTKEGRKRLDRIRKQFEKLEDDFDELTNDQIRARTDALAAEVRDVLASELVPARSRKDEDDDEDEKARPPPVDRESKDDERGGPQGATTPAQPAPSTPPATTPSTPTAPPQDPPTAAPAP